MRRDLRRVILPGEEIIAGDDERFRVLALLPLEDESPFVGRCRSRRHNSRGGESSASRLPIAAPATDSPLVTDVPES